jgi:hypothetical protein
VKWLVQDLNDVLPYLAMLKRYRVSLSVYVRYTDYVKGFIVAISQGKEVVVYAVPSLMIDFY